MIARTFLCIAKAFQGPCSDSFLSSQKIFSFATLFNAAIPSEDATYCDFTYIKKALESTRSSSFFPMSEGALALEFDYFYL